MKLAAEFLEHIVNVRGFSPQTAVSYKQAILDFERTLGIDDPATVKLTDLDRYLTRKALRGVAATTRRARAHALKSFFKFLAGRGHIPSDPGKDLRPPDERVGTITVLTEPEIMRMIFEYVPPVLRRGRRECFKFFERRRRIAETQAARNTAMLAMMYSLGLRVSEVGAITTEALIPDAKGNLFIDLMGKAARQPTRFLIDEHVAALVDQYLVVRRRNSLEHPALFSPVDMRRPDLRGRAHGIGNLRIRQIILDRVRAVGVDPKGRKITPHVFRYSLATHLYEAAFKPERIQQVLRHGSLLTTMRYIRLGTFRSAQRGAIAQLPWNRKGLATRMEE